MKVSQKIKRIKINDILPNPYQVRRNFDAKALGELAESIKRNGVLSPVLVRGCISGYELICGQRRVRAARMAGLEDVPAIVIRVGDAQCAELSMTENIQRQDLSSIEEAEGYFNLMSYHHVKKEKMQKNLSIDFARVNEKICLLSLSKRVRYKIEENKIPESFLREILKIRDEGRQIELIEEISKGETTYKSLCESIKKEIKIAASGEKDKKRRKDGCNFAAKMPLYKNTVNKTVELLKKSGAIVTFEEKDDEKYSEFILKVHKI